MKRLLTTFAIVGILASCGGDSDSSTETAAPVADVTTTMAPATTVPAETTPTTVSATTVPADTTVISFECQLGAPYSTCAPELTPKNDATGCPTPKPDNANPTTISILPCEYGFWVLMAEEELVRQGYAVIADGYYASTEVAEVKRAQTVHGVAVDGQIGPSSWVAIMAGFDCSASDAEQAPLLQGTDECFGDLNGDGFYSPGDMIPD
jgi:peptidoglycan hydrolase-like protein with peptidoglycan-binding domain